MELLGDVWRGKVDEHAFPAFGRVLGVLEAYGLVQAVLAAEAEDEWEEAGCELGGREAEAQVDVFDFGGRDHWHGWEL